MVRGVSSVNGCFNLNSVCLRQFSFISCWIIRVSIFNGPRVCSRLMVALPKLRLFGSFFLSYCIIKLKWLQCWLMSLLNYWVSIFGQCSSQPNQFVGVDNLFVTVV